MALTRIQTAEINTHVYGNVIMGHGENETFRKWYGAVGVCIKSSDFSHTIRKGNPGPPCSSGRNFERFKIKHREVLVRNCGGLSKDKVVL